MISSEDKKEAAQVPVQFSCISGVNPLKLQEEIGGTKSARVELMWVHGNVQAIIECTVLVTANNN